MSLWCSTGLFPRVKTSYSATPELEHKRMSLGGNQSSYCTLTICLGVARTLMPEKDKPSFSSSIMIEMPPHVFAADPTITCGSEKKPKNSSAPGFLIMSVFC